MTGLVTEFLAPDPSVTQLAGQIAERAAGNPSFAEEIVRDLADRGVLCGERGAYTCADEATDVDVPATVQAATAARIDRLVPEAKLALNAAAVIGLRFEEALLAALADTAALEPLLKAELIDQVTFTSRAEYAFRHPLIRSVAYRSQLAMARAELHRRLAVALEARNPVSAEENGALIAEHLEVAGDLAAAHAAAMIREFIPIGEPDVLFWKYTFGVCAGALRPDAAAVRETAEILQLAQQRADDLSVWSARFLHGFVLAHNPNPRGAAD